MNYDPQVWVDEPAEDSPLEAARFNHMEQGIKAAHDRLDEAFGLTPDGPLATTSSTYRDAATAARGGTGQLRILTIGDSTCDGYAGGLPGAPTSWSQTWPLQLAERLRTAWGLPAGGRGWVGASTPLLPANYGYDVTSRAPAGGGLDQLNMQIGIPGSLWLHHGHATNVTAVTWQLTPGVTSVDLVLAAYGDPITVTTATRGAETITPNGDPITVRILDPGASLSVTPAANGFGLLGMIEHRGDENTGVSVANLAQAAMRADEYATWLTDPDYTLAPVLTAYTPDVALVCLGANDYGNGRTPAQLTSDLETIHAGLSAARPGVVVVFVIRDLADEAGSPYTWANYAAAIAAAGTSTGAAVLDMRPIVPNGAAGAYLTDGVHLTPAGNAAFAGGVADYLALGRAGIDTAMISDMSELGRQIARADDAGAVRAAVGAVGSGGALSSLWGGPASERPATGTAGVLYVTW